MSDTCPKCGHPRVPGDENCGRCGVIFARIHGAVSTGKIPDDTSSIRKGGAGGIRGTAPFPSIPVPTERNTPLIAIKAFFLLALAIYGLRLAIPPIASNAAGESYLHLVNLPFHEAGHILFTPFGRFLQILGGSLMQLIVPAVVAGTFIYQRQLYSSSVGLWWLGESLLDLAPYIDDARAGQLLLLGGVTGSEVEDYHDWEGILSRLGMMQYDHALARCALGVGVIIMLGSVAWGGWILWNEYSSNGQTT